MDLKKKSCRKLVKTRYELERMILDIDEELSLRHYDIVVLDAQNYMKGDENEKTI